MDVAASRRNVTPPTARATYDGGGVVVDWMLLRRIDHFFTVPGESFLPVLDALRDENSIRLVTTRHEAGAAFAAEGFAKMTGRPAVCMATRGPGACNLSIGIHTAHYDGTPLLALVGLSPSRLDGSGAFQAFEPQTMFRSIAKDVLVVRDVQSLAMQLDQAYEIAVGGRPGPVVVGLPIEVIEARLPFDPQPVIERIRLPEVEWDAGLTAELIQGARAPRIIVAGDAVRGAAADDLHAFVEAVGIPVFAAWRRFSSFNNVHPCFVGSLGLGSSPLVGEALRESDLIICIGFAVEEITAKSAFMDRIDATLVQLAPAATPERARHVGRATFVDLHVSFETAARGLRMWSEREQGAARHLRDRHRPETLRLVQSCRPDRPGAPRPGRAHLDYFMSCLDRVVPANAVVTSDAGNFAQWLLRYLTFDRERVYLGPVNGAMGYGLPSAIGAALADHGRTVWCVAGDGGFMMLAGEMETAERLGLDIVAVVVNNEAYGTIKARQEAAYPSRPSGTSLGAVDFGMLARSMGWRSWLIENDADVMTSLVEAEAANGRRLLEVRVEQVPLALV